MVPAAEVHVVRSVGLVPKRGIRDLARALHTRRTPHHGLSRWKSRFLFIDFFTFFLLLLLFLLHLLQRNLLML